MAFFSRNSLATCWSYNQELGGGGGGVAVAVAVLVARG